MRVRSSLVFALTVAAPAMTAQTHVVVVSGLGGDAAHRERFHAWAVAMIDAAQQRFGVPSDNITYLAERTELDPQRISAKSTKENVERTLVDLSTGLQAGEGVFILLIGHGSYQGDESRFNLPGPDMTSNDFARLLDRFAAQDVVLVNTTSASGDFIKELSGPRRTIITATKSPFERNETVFCQYFVEAFARDVADVDKDERVSVLEAFNYATHEVRRAYEDDDRLLTEHAQLDDNGDGEGTGDPDPATTDGAVAHTFVIEGTVAVVAGTSSDSVLAGLKSRQRELQQAISELRIRKDTMEPEAYESQLEQLLLELARVSQAIREREGGA
ncbi:MAG: hypothetical protein JSW51_13510 [Gemmatimonadota bacterium]|nr:MAG: hypothetical protein JSW51_13510 [Gemmatimonadota bacterium]